MKKLTFALIICLFSSCQLFEPKPESEKFYCKHNGKAWRPEKNSTSLGTNLKAEWNKKGKFNILAYQYPEYVWMLLKVDSGGIKIGKYDLSNDITNSVGNYSYDYRVSNNEVTISKSGFVNITKVENKQVSGTFEFTTHSNIQNKDYKITKGQFNNLYYSEF